MTHWWTMLGLLVACGGDDGVPVTDRTVEVACGTCVFEMEGAAGCFWAAKIDGVVHPVGGVMPPEKEHDPHGPEGYCNVTRKAVVDGSIRADGRFLSTRFELLPYDGQGARPAHKH